MSNYQDTIPQVDISTLANEEEIALTHAQAEAIRRRKERNGKLSAFIITVVVHVVAILILTLIVLPAMQVEIPPIKAKTAPPTEGTIDTPITQQTVRQKPSAPSTSAKLINSHSPTATVFTPTVPVENESMDLGLGASLGLGLGGFGDGQGDMPGLPDSIRGRCTPQERLKRLREGGGTPEVEEAVKRALRWFQANQNSDGSWGQRAKGGMTGLVLLAYFGHCETPLSREYGETVTKGLAYLIDLGKQKNGLLGTVGGHGSVVYEHAMATYALCEGLTFCNELKHPFPGLQEAAENGVKIILEGQSSNGFWAYGYATASGQADLSITGWQLQALKAAEHAGFKSKELTKAVDKALDMLISVQADDGTFGYRNKSSTGDRLVGVGTLCLQMFGKERSKEVRESLRWMNRNLDPVYNSSNSNLYGWYYITLALFQRGDSYWDRWNRKWRDEMLNSQNEDGSWKVEGNFEGGGIRSTKTAGVDAAIYRNALNTLSLEAYYRFLPGTGGGN